MRKIILLLCALFFFQMASPGQTGKIDTLIIKYVPRADTVKYWSFDGTYSLTLQQIGYHNWAKGGQSSFAFGSNINFSATWEKQGNLLENRLDTGYGLIWEGSSDKETKRLKKNEDYFIIVIRYGRHLFNKWYLEGIIDFRSQYSPGYKYNNDNIRTKWISDFMAPGYLRPSLGASYKNNNFSFAAAPISGKITFMASDSLRKVPDLWKDPSKTIEWESGPSITISDKREIFRNVTLQYNLLIFARYSTIFKEYPDLNAEIYFRFYVNKYISANFNLRAIYDNNVRMEYIGRPGQYFIPFQINYNLNIGFAINFWNTGDNRKK